MKMKNNVLKKYKEPIYKCIISTPFIILCNGTFWESVLALVAIFSMSLYEYVEKSKKKYIFYIATFAIWIIIGLLWKDIGFVVFGVVPITIVALIAPDGKNFYEDIRYFAIFMGLLLVTEYLNRSFYSMFVYLSISEGYIGNSFAVLLNCYILFVIIKCVCDIVRSRKKGFLIVSVLYIILSIINFFVYSFVKQSVTFNDIYKLGTALTVLERQHISSKIYMKLAIGLILYAIILTAIITAPERNKKKYKIPTLLVDVILIIILCVAGSVTRSTLVKFNGGQMYGLNTNLLLTAGNSFRKPTNPIDYTEYDCVYEEALDQDKPNIIVIMSEAFTDLEYGIGAGITGEYMPFFKTLCENNESGIAYASVYGNNTVTSEMEFLTGVSSLLTTEGSEMWRKYINENSWTIVKDLEEQGYRTYGIHPNLGGNYYRKVAWEKMGFDDTTFITDMDSDKTVFYRGMCSDESNFNMIIEKYEECKKSGQPFFCFNVTMQNHADYDEDLTKYNFDTVDSTIQDNELNKRVSNYATLMRQSDNALKNLISYFQQQKEETIVMVFGDHQPVFVKEVLDEQKKPYEKMTLEEQADMFKVPYLIWNNKLNKDIDVTHETTSINYLSRKLYCAAGLKQEAIIGFNKLLEEEYPVITRNFVIDKKGEITEGDNILNKLKEVKSEEQEYYLIKVMQCMGYDYLKRKMHE